MLRLILMTLLVTSLCACSGHAADDDAAARAAAAPGPAARQKTVFDEQLKALDKAKAVQQTVDEAAKAQHEAIDASERTDPPAGDDKGG